MLTKKLLCVKIKAVKNKNERCRKTENKKAYIAIDLKSFYASVECIERGLDPLDTNLVVADGERTEKTICLAVSPALKGLKISGRARLFEVVKAVSDANEKRKNFLNAGFSGESFFASELKKNPSLKISYITAPPRMALYSKYSTDIYALYLKYIAPEDMHIYSVDEVFIDATDYLKSYKTNAKQLTEKIISEVFEKTGITATAGIGTNLYLAKIAMDVMAKKMKPDKNGARIAYLDEKLYRQELWGHTPITDFWRVGKGYAKKLEEHGIFTMGDIARCSLSKYGEDKLYKMFGVNAELLIDHAWGTEPCTIADIKAYRPQNSSLSYGQVLKCPYDFFGARLVAKEMAEHAALDLVEKGVVCDQLVLTVGYDVENLANPDISKKYKGEITADAYGRKVPKHAHGTENLELFTSSSKLISKGVTTLFDRIVNKDLLVRRITLAANRIKFENETECKNTGPVQLELFEDYDAESDKDKNLKKHLEKEKNLQKAVIDIKKQFGKNAVLKGMNFEKGATAIERNGQIGGHKA